MFTLTNFTFLLLWLLFCGLIWVLKGMDLSDKNLEEGGFSESFKKHAKIVRNRMNRQFWIVILVGGTIFGILSLILDKSMFEILLIGGVASILFFVPPVQNASINIATMIIMKINMMFDDELTKEKIKINKLKNELRERWSSKEFLVDIFKKAGKSQEFIDAINSKKFDPTPPDEESLNLTVASQKSSEAFNYLRAGNYDKARVVCEAILWLKNDYAITWQYYGTVLLMQGEVEAAISAFNNAKKYNPSFFPAYFMLSFAYIFLGDHNEAKKIRSAGKFVLNSSSARKLIDETGRFDKYGMFDDLYPGQSTDEFFNEYKKLVLDDDEFEKLLKEAKNIKWDSESIKKSAEKFRILDIL